jgi:membrane protein YdbS with pleckstrin-like domain
VSIALWAWIIVGAIVGLIALISIIAMIPELVRYMKLKSM